jgi:arginase
VQVDLITVPYRYDEYNEGLGAGPDALLEAGIEARIRAAGHDVGEPHAAMLPDEQREPGRTVVNSGRIGARTAALVADARRRHAGVVILAGDDTASIGVVAGLQQAAEPDAPIGVVWLDAHGDFNTPETSYSGILAGMPLAILAGMAGPNWRAEAGLTVTVPADRILIAGVRELDDQEAALLRASDVTVLTADKLRKQANLDEAISKVVASCSVVYLHVDLDVLDPYLVPSASTPSQHGLELDETVEVMASVCRTGKVAAICISSLNPGGGERGRRSIRTALSLVERALAAWTRAPDGDRA